MSDIDKRLAEIAERASKATAGPWVAEQATRREHTIHWDVRTQDKLPEHPWSPRFIAWMTGLVFDALPRLTGQRIVECPTCHTVNVDHRSLQIPIDVRWDDQTEADAQFLAYSRTDIPWLLEQIATLRAKLADLETAAGIFGGSDDGADAGSLGPVAYEDLPDRATGAIRWEYAADRDAGLDHLDGCHKITGYYAHENDCSCGLYERRMAARKYESSGKREIGTEGL
jgi:hypothetical protein